MSKKYSGKYADIIDLPHYQSKKRPHMSNYERAAQFSSFAALSGYEVAVAEAGRLTEAKIELSDEQARALDQSLQHIAAHIAEEPEVTITYFQPDGKKQGGAYVEKSGRVHRIDAIKGMIVLQDRIEVPIWDILRIDGELLRNINVEF